jgi:signal transduction histidine kinase
MARSSLRRAAEPIDLLRIAAQLSWRCGPDLRVDSVDALDPDCGNAAIRALRGARLDKIGKQALYPAERRAFADILARRSEFADAALTLPSTGDGLLHLTLSAKPVRDDAGGFRGYVGIARVGAERPFDTVQRQELVALLRRTEAARDREQRLRRESEALLAALNALHEPIPVADKCRAILKAFEPLLECDAAMVVRRGVSGALAVVVSTLGDGETATWPDGPLIASALAGRASVHEDLSAENATAGLDPTLVRHARSALFAPLRIGREHAVLIALHGRPGAFGEPHLAVMQRLGLVATQAFEAEESRTALVNASKLATLGEMLAAIVHEVNQPLSIISMAAQNARFLVQSNAPPAEVLEKLERTESQARRAGEIVNGIRGLAHPNRAVAAAIAVEPRQILGAIRVVTEGSLRTKGIALEIDVPDPCRKLRADPGGLQQVLLNLIVNARDAVGERLRRDGRKSGGRIAVSVEDRTGDDKLRIRVADDGGGIPADVIDRIFDPFFTLKEMGKGTGLGLSICQSLLADMGGTLAVRNDVEGAVFEIVLAAAEA